jgi:hypothetical protein
MPLVYRHESRTFRVDGDVLETFIRGESERRVLLAWLSVQVFPFPKGRLGVAIESLLPDMEMPPYKVLQKPPKAVKGIVHTAVGHVISPEEEPALREFFTQVAQLCGRPVVP